MAAAPIIPTCKLLIAAALATAPLAVAAQERDPPAAAGAAAASAAAAVPGPVVPDLSGLFVRARAAEEAGAVATATQAYRQILAAAPDDTTVARRAYRQAIAAGDYLLAGRAAAVLVRAGEAPPDTALLAVAIALHEHDAAGAERAIDRLGTGPLDFLVPSLRAWLARDRGQDALAVLDADGPGSGLARRYSARTRVLLLAAAGRQGEAALGLAAAEMQRDGAALRIDMARVLARGGDRRAARALLAKSDEAEARALRDRLDASAPNDAAFGAARLFLMVADDLSDDQVAPLVLLLARATLLLDDGDDRARLVLARTLADEGALDDALAALDTVRGRSAYAREAAALRVDVLAEGCAGDAALRLAHSLARSRGGTATDSEAYGRMLAERGRLGEAASAYAHGLSRGAGPDAWRLHYLRGMALDALGEWPAAATELRRAITLAPDASEAMGYLGYALVERGAAPAEAQALLERARKLEPRNAEIADALAWAYFRQGDAARALPLLEQAVQDDPLAARANEHLGDVYWQQGRRYEARYAWRAAALTADADAAARIDAKLAGDVPVRSDR